MRWLVRYLVLIVLLSIAVWQDVRSYSVSNKLLLVTWMASLGCQIFYFGVKGILGWCLGSAIPMVLMFGLVLLQMFGAADAKLFSVIGSLFGIEFVLKNMAYALIAGTVLSIIQIFRYGNLKIRLHFLAKYITESITEGKVNSYYEKERDGRRCVIPFALAIGAGTILQTIVFPKFIM